MWFGMIKVRLRRRSAGEYRESYVASQASGDCCLNGAARRQHSNGFRMRSILCGGWQEKLRPSSSNGGQAVFPSSSQACSRTSGGLCGMPQDRSAVLAAAPGLCKLCSDSGVAGKFAAFFRHNRNSNHGSVHVQSRLASAAGSLANHRFCMGLQRRVDDSGGA